MSGSESGTLLASGFREFDADEIDSVPDAPGVFRLYSSGQRLIYVGHAGEEGLRRALTDLHAAKTIPGVGLFEYEGTDDADSAAERAQRQIEQLKPLCNLGFGRYRSGETGLPRQGHRVRLAIRNPE